MTASSMADPAASYSRGRVRRLVKRKALNKSYRSPSTSPTVARKLKALEEDVHFHHSLLKHARDVLNTELANITQKLKK